MATKFIYVTKLTVDVDIEPTRTLFISRASLHGVVGSPRRRWTYLSIREDVDIFSRRANHFLLASDLKKWFPNRKKLF